MVVMVVMVVGAMLAAASPAVAAAPSAVPPLSPAPPVIEGEAEARSTNGAFLLTWAQPGEQALAQSEYEYELEESRDPKFAAARLRYRGSFPSWFMSGRRDGAYSFRVRSRSWTAGPAPGPWSEWSAAKLVTVEHHDLGFALVLFGFGAAVFLATCLTLIHGSRVTSRSP